MKKQLKAFFQGTWLGHPLHPILVHLPTALWPAALVFDVLTRFDVGGNPMVRASFYAILLGLVAAVAAAPAGFVDWSGIKQGRPAWKLGLYHMGLNLTATAIFLIDLLLRIDDRDARQVGALPLALSAVGVALLAVAGYLGGRLVYEHGISVARQSKATWRRIAEAGGAHLPAEKAG